MVEVVSTAVVAAMAAADTTNAHNIAGPTAGDILGSPR
jgi:hypothetical protein